MNRLVFNVLVAALTLAACVPGLSQNSGAGSVATSQASILTVAAQTMAVLPTLTLPPTNTPLPTATATLAPPTNTKVPATATVTKTAASGTNTATATLTSTGTPATSTSTVTGTLPSPTNTVTGTPPTATQTPGLTPLAWGTQPPYIHYGRVRLVNQAKRDVYISFQCTTPEGYLSIVEYPVYGTITVSVPAGRCEWVAWVGGRQFTGIVGISRWEELTMTFKKDSVTIK
jgi:hypothetical protein